MPPTKVIDFKYTPPPIEIKITKEALRKTLTEVQDALLRHSINGGERKLNMSRVCTSHGCGTAACIGGWVSIFLIGFEAKTWHERDTVGTLFGKLLGFDDSRMRLHNLFYGFERTTDYNKPNVAATAIQRYLDGERPWPNGKMPNVLRYRRAKK